MSSQTVCVGEHSLQFWGGEKKRQRNDSEKSANFVVEQRSELDGGQKTASLISMSAMMSVKLQGELQGSCNAVHASDMPQSP